jgi:PAS domain S-box-containing protein
VVLTQDKGDATAVGRRALAYVLAGMAVGVAISFRFLLDPLVGNRFPLVPFFFLAVLWASAYGGPGPGLLATLAGALAGAFVPPSDTFGQAGFDSQAGVAVYLGVSFGMVYLGNVMRRTQGEARALAARALKDAEELRITLTSIGDGVIVTDARGHVTSMNPVAETLTGVKDWQARGRALETVFRIFEEKTREGVPSPVERVLTEGRITGLANHTILIAQDGQEHLIDDSAAPLRGRGGEILGVVLVFREVGERRRSEEVQRRLASIVENSEDAIIGKSLDGTITSWNAGAERLYGYSAQEVLGKPSAFLTPDDRIGERSAILVSLKDKNATQSLETVRRAKDGRLIDVSMSMAPIRDDAGNVIGSSTIARDISHYKRAAAKIRGLNADLERRVSELSVAQEKLRLSELDLADSFENASVGLHWMDGEGTILRVNQAELTLLGYAREEYVGRNIAEFHVDGRVIAEILRRLHAGETLHVVPAQMRCKDGSVRDVVIASSVLWVAGTFVHTRCFTTDVTDRKRAEEALQKSEHLYRAIGESIDYGVWVCEPDGRNVYASDSFLNLVGLTQEECSAFGWERVLHPDDVERTLSAWKECVRTEGAWDVEHRFKGRDGSWHPVLARGGPVRNDRGEIVAWAGINLDISRLKQAEERLREADRNKNDFLAVLAHELRNPLAPLFNALGILKRPDAGQAALVEARDMAERQVHHLARLVDDLLDVSRITHGKIELRKEHMELSIAVARAVETALPAIEAQGHELTVSLPPAPIWLHADLVRIAQVLSNLLNNSAKYTKPAGKISLSVEEAGGEAVVRVRDTGIGMPEAALSQVFEMFAQAAPPDSRSPMSLGVGLRLVKSLVELHGGSVLAQSAGPGKGSEFVVRLPTVAPPVRLADEVAPLPQPTPPRRVLVVDDNADAASSLAVLLKLEGHEARVAHNGPSALEAVEQSPPDVVFLDIGMSGMDGYEVARRLRALRGARGLKLIALTGWGQEHDRQRARAAGFDHHLTKPVVPNQLHALLAADPGS